MQEDSLSRDRIFFQTMAMLKQQYKVPESITQSYCEQSSSGTGSFRFILWVGFPLISKVCTVSKPRRFLNSSIPDRLCRETSPSIAQLVPSGFDSLNLRNIFMSECSMDIAVPCNVCVSYPQALPCLAHVYFESRLEPPQQSFQQILERSLLSYRNCDTHKTPLTNCGA